MKTFIFATLLVLSLSQTSVSNSTDSSVSSMDSVSSHANYTKVHPKLSCMEKLCYPQIQYCNNDTQCASAKKCINSCTKSSTSRTEINHCSANCSSGLANNHPFQSWVQCKEACDIENNPMIAKCYYMRCVDLWDQCESDQSCLDVIACSNTCFGDKACLKECENNATEVAVGTTRCKENCFAVNETVWENKTFPKHVEKNGNGSNHTKHGNNTHKGQNGHGNQNKGNGTHHQGNGTHHQGNGTHHQGNRTVHQGNGTHHNGNGTHPNAGKNGKQMNHPKNGTRVGGKTNVGSNKQLKQGKSKTNNSTNHQGHGGNKTAHAHPGNQNHAGNRTAQTHPRNQKNSNDNSTSIISQ